MAAAAMTHSMTTGTPLDIRVRVRVVQGGYRWFRATAYPRRDEKGNVIRWYGYTEDIHEHVLVEQRSEEHTSELQSLMGTSYAVFCLKKKNNINDNTHINNRNASNKNDTNKTPKQQTIKRR